MTMLDKKRVTFIPDPQGVSFSGTLRSEFIKITSLRSTVALLLAIIVFGIGVSVALAFTMEGAGIPDQASAPFMLDQVTLGTVLFGQLITAVLGVLIISGEYSSGTIQPTLIAVPTRLPVLGAKALVLFLLTTASGLIATFGSWAATYPLFAGLDLAAGLTTPGVLMSFIGASVYVGLSAILGLGVGALLRSVAASVATAMSVILLLPIVLSVLPASQVVRNLQLLSMSKAGDAMSNPVDSHDGFVDLAAGHVSTGAGWAIAVIWAIGFLVLGAVRLRRGDA
ncbi:ABC transporter permease subunit [Plantibacter sp. VKM Ac-2880]|uniref:ABC transporter permease n=1 Tax=Plantibacter sp. VKM Ac-2880 TaxID=2783827 RepID=UPI00188F9DE3|nr:ABC transporter permease subunit [Plantibacter sp. VKM Ac-2880]MBF4567293.1 ABC transporter permease subunit [Plantibacter sp. VKM Ac-2880]